MSFRRLCVIALLGANLLVAQTATSQVLPETVLGNSDLVGWSTAIQQLPNGQLFAVNYKGVSTVSFISKIEFLVPTGTSIVDVTSSAAISLSNNVGAIAFVNTIQVGKNSLPDIILCDGGIDESPWNGGQVRVLVPNAIGQYADRTSSVPQITAFNHRCDTGIINGASVFVASMINTAVGARRGIELVRANLDETFTDLSSYLPADIASIPSNQFLTYTYSAIADFTGHGGDIFLGSENSRELSSFILLNDGRGNFSKSKSVIPLPAMDMSTQGTAGIPIVHVLATKFVGSSNADAIVNYANAASTKAGGTSITATPYYLQFLKGDGNGNFVDVTLQHLAIAPKLDNWIRKIEQVTINGFNDLVLYSAGAGCATILVNDGQDHYTASQATLPSDIANCTWGTNAGVQGFFGITQSQQWVFVPVSQAKLTLASNQINAPLADQLYLYDTNGSVPYNKDKGVEATISVTAHGKILQNPTTATMTMKVNDQIVGSATLAPVKGFAIGTNDYTTDQTLNFKVSGLKTISKIEILSNISNNDIGDNLYIGKVVVNGVDLGIANYNNWNGFSDLIDASAWNASLANTIGSSTNQIQVSAGGGISTVVVLGNYSQYAISGIGTGNVTLTESAGLNQNAVLKNASFVQFQDGTVLDLKSGKQTSAAPAAVPDAGWWYNQYGAAGRGYSLEVNNGRILIAAYMYRDDGSPIWYLADEVFANGSFSGTLFDVQGTQTLSSSGAGKTSLGSASIKISGNFSSATQGTITLTDARFAGGSTSIPITRFPIDSVSVKAPATAISPQTGWWWNTNEPGVGYFIEQQGSQIFYANYLYGDDQRDLWFISLNNVLPSGTSGVAMTGSLLKVTGGQTLTSGPKTGTAATAGQVTLQFTSPTSGAVTLPGGRVVQISRFNAF